MRVKARSIGPIAKRMLQQSRSAKVMACFDRSLYLEVGTGLICVADACLYDGPLNLLVRLESRSAEFFNSLASVGERWIVEDGLRLRSDAGAACIELATASIWQSKSARMPLPDKIKIDGGLRALRELIASRSGPKGLIDLAVDQALRPRSAVERAAWKPLHTVRNGIRDWLEGAEAGLDKPISALLGLGPGLTPSGDDLIAGFLIASHHVGNGGAASALWKRLEDQARLQTNRISFAHLVVAGQGAGAAPLHDLLDAISDNSIEQIAKILDDVDKIGHSSGWDAVAGLLLLLEAWIETGEDQAVAA